MHSGFVWIEGSTPAADALSGVGRGFDSNYKAILIRRSQREMTDIITLSEWLSVRHRPQARPWPTASPASPGSEDGRQMFSTLRAPIPTEIMPRKVRFTCNPSGPGHNAVKHRFKLSGVPEAICGPCITEVGKDGVPATRRMIYCSYDDNALLKQTEPEYMRRIETACEGDAAKLRAWKYGDWDIVRLVIRWVCIKLTSPDPEFSN